MSGPAYHARTHLPGGTDPLRGLLPSTVTGDYPASIRALPDLRGYWRLGEGSSPYADTSGEEAGDMVLRDAVGGGTAMSPNVDPGLLVAAHDDGAVAFNQPGDVAFGGNPQDFLSLDSNANFDFGSGHPTMSVIARIKPSSDLGPLDGGIAGDTRFISSSGGYGQGWALRILYPSLQAEFWRGTSVSSQQAATSFALAAAQTYSIGGTYDGTLIRLYINGTQVASVADATNLGFSSASDLAIGGYHSTDPGAALTLWRPFVGVIDEVAVFGSVLTDADMAALHSAAETGETPPGWVPIIPPGGGGPVWGPPGTEVEHPGGEEEENPQDGSGYTGATSAGGWHYEAHFEYVVLYDTNPGRFDVPPRKWVRVPFNTVRIQRRWELDTDDYIWRDAWLPDDRGLSEHAKQGVLLVTPGMTFGSEPEEVGGWYSLEYPMLASSGLPNYPLGEESSPDYYVRAARMTNVANGQVLRAGASLPAHPSWRVFHTWPFSTPADGDLGITFVDADNPFPAYQAAAGRPLNKPLPYPKKSNADSLDDYKSLETGAPGFDADSWASRTSLSAGDAISLQAWQDSPWTLRFGTDKYPPYTPLSYRETWRKRPALILFHYYDPETVDHETGTLL